MDTGWNSQQLEVGAEPQTLLRHESKEHMEGGAVFR